MSSKISQVHILGIYNTTKVGNVSFVVTGLRCWMRATDAGREVGMASLNANQVKK